VLNAIANCYLFAVQMLIIFYMQYKSLLPFLGGWVFKSLLGQHAAVKNAICYKLFITFTWETFVSGYAF